MFEHAHEFLHSESADKCIRGDRKLGCIDDEGVKLIVSKREIVPKGGEGFFHFDGGEVMGCTGWIDDVVYRGGDLLSLSGVHMMVKIARIYNG